MGEKPLDEKIRDAFRPEWHGHEDEIAELVEILAGRFWIYETGGIVIEDFDDYDKRQKSVAYAVAAMCANIIGVRPSPWFSRDEWDTRFAEEIEPSPILIREEVPNGERWKLPPHQTALCAAQDLLEENFVDEENFSTDA